MTRAARRGWSPLCLALAVWACNPARHEERAPKASPSASARPAAPSAVPSPSAGDVRPGSSEAGVRDVVCRALHVSGEVRSGERLLSSGQPLDDEQWITLAEGASVTVKHSGSGREWALRGPARLRACHRGREQLLLARGAVGVGSGMGARPGAEVLIATPIGALLYADADFDLTLDGKLLEVKVRAGRVALEPAQAGKRPGSPISSIRTLRAPFGKPDAVSLMASCRQAARAAEAAARHVSDKSAPEPLGERARNHARARRSARVACSIAEAATGLVADRDQNAGLWAEALRAEAIAETIPGARTAPDTEK